MNTNLLKQLHLVVFLSLFNTLAIGALVVHQLPAAEEGVISMASTDDVDEVYYRN